MPIQGIGNCIPIQTTETLHMKELMFDAYKSLKTLLYLLVEEENTGRTHQLACQPAVQYETVTEYR